MDAGHAYLLQAHGFRGPVRTNRPPESKALSGSLFSSQPVPLLLSAEPWETDVIFTSFQKVHRTHGTDWILRGRTAHLPHYESDNVQLFVLRGRSERGDYSITSFAQEIAGQDGPVHIIP